MHGSVDRGFEAVRDAFVENFARRREPGAVGSLGFADPDAEVGYAYVTNQMGTSVTGDPRDLALRDALYAVLDALTTRRDPRVR